MKRLVHTLKRTAVTFYFKQFEGLDTSFDFELPEAECKAMS